MSSFKEEMCKLTYEGDSLQGCSKGELLKIIVDCCPTVWESNYIDEHRWYGLREVVVELEGKFIKYEEYRITGDNSMCDMDLEYNLNDFSFVEKKTRTVEETYYD